MFYNKLLEKIILPAGDTLLQTNFIKELKWWRSVDHLSVYELQQLQKERLQKLMQHAVTNSPYYKKLNISFSGDAFADIKKFPLLTKQTLRKEGDLLLSSNAKNLIIEKSSGSSGLQTQVYMSKQENSRSQAALIYLWEKCGYRLGDKIMQTGMTLNRGIIKSLKDFLLNTAYTNAYDLAEEKLCAYLQKAKKGNYTFLAGYASSLNALAKAAIANNIQAPFKTIISWGDKLFDHYKKNIASAFNNPAIHELYGTTEGFVISGTCVQDNHHILTPHVYLELLDKNGNEVKPGEYGYVVATRLDAYSYPLIRCYLGDLAIKKDEKIICGCGSHFPMLEKIIGRDTDIVQTPSDKDLIVHFFTGTFEHFQQIEQFRILQKETGKIEIEYIPAANFSPNVLNEIEKMMFAKANEVFPVIWKCVDKIPATKSGKPQIIENLIAQKPADFL